MPTRRRQPNPWTRQHLTTLRQGARQKIGAKKIARATGHTESAVRQKAQTMGISLRITGMKSARKRA